jgi:hypothetical protein
MDWDNASARLREEVSDAWNDDPTLAHLNYDAILRDVVLYTANNRHVPNSIRDLCRAVLDWDRKEWHDAAGRGLVRRGERTYLVFDHVPRDARGEAREPSGQQEGSEGGGSVEGSGVWIDRSVVEAWHTRSEPGVNIPPLLRVPVRQDNDEEGPTTEEEVNANIERLIAQWIDEPNWVDDDEAADEGRER